MKVGLKKNKKNKQNTEEAMHRWLKGADLGKLASQYKFQKAHFPDIKPTNWDKLYQEFQKSKPINIRLPIRVIDKLKQISLQKGIAYQTLIRLWITEKLQMS